MSNTKVSAMAAGAPAQAADAFHIARSGADYKLTIDDIAAYLLPNASYYFHGFAGQQVNGDPKFYDVSGAGNHGAPGANLSVENAWANDYYVSTITPAGGATDSVIRIPSLNFDYAGGEKLILWWLGIVTAPGSNAAMMGDGLNGTHHGIKVRANATGKFQIGLYDAVSSSGLFGGASTDTAFNGALHSIALVLDGENKKYGMWVDEIYDSALSGAYSTFGSGTDVDTQNSNTFNLGASAPAAAASTDGTATLTRALAIIRLGAGADVPAVATLTAIFQQLRASPGRPVAGSAF